MNPSPMKTPQPIVYMIIGTACAVVLSIVAADIFIAVKEIQTGDSFLVLKDVLLTTLGAILGFLANTRSAEVKLDGTKTETTTSVTKSPLPDEEKDS